MRLMALARLSASSAAIALLSVPAMAQDDQDVLDAQEGPAEETFEEEPASEIIVTGIRASLESSQAIRRNSEQIVDAVVAEDIGKLPDLNTAQTAARIPGVQVYRQGGEAQNVLVRGLPNFTTTYNGREIFTAETRVVALQDFPSANIAALEVFKTSSAELVEPGLAGLVNVRSRRPFDFTEGEVSASIWGTYTNQADKITPNFNALVTERWDTGIGEIGVLVNASYTELQYLDSEPSNTDFLQTFSREGNRLVCCGPADPNQAGARFPDIQRLFYRSGNRKRPSVNAAIQWRPSDSLELYGDFLWQGFRNEINDRLVAVPLYNGGSYSNLVFRESTNLLSSGTVTGLADPIFTFQGGTFNKTDTFQFAGGAIYEAGPLRVALDVARTDTTFKGSTESVDRIFAGQATTTVDFNFEVPEFTIRGFDPTNPANYLFDGLFEQKQQATGKDWQVRLDASYEFDNDFLRSIELGARYVTRDAFRLFGDRFAGFRGRGINASALPLEFELTPPGFIGTNIQSGFQRFLSPTYDSIRGNLAELRQFVISNGGANYTVEDLVPGLLFDAEEETLAGYIQANWALGDQLDGQIGLRALRVETSVSGPQPTGIDVIDEGSTNEELLPSASIRWRPVDDIQLRLAVSRTVTRPNFADLVPNITFGAPPPGGVGTPSLPFQAFGGNPFLQPFESWNYDASIEYFFARAGFASLTVFRRDLDGFFQSGTVDIPDVPDLGFVRLNTIANSGKGRIDGAEFQFQAFADFDWVPEWAQGFGVQANVTYLDAATDQPAPGGGFARLPIADQLNGVSEWNYNLVGIYEMEGFSTRLTYNGRSNFAAARQLRGDAGASDVYTETASPADRLDLSINYDIVPNATIFFDWTNITRTPFEQFFSSARDGATRADYVRYLRFDETTVSLGLRFKL